MGSIYRCSTFASVGSSHVAVVTCCPFLSCTVIALMRPFVLGGSADAAGLSFVCCSVVVFGCFDVLPSVMLSSSVLLDVGLPAGTLAGATDGANHVSAVVGCAGVCPVIVTLLLRLVVDPHLLASSHPVL